jgi:hypothetical protein
MRILRYLLVLLLVNLAQAAPKAAESVVSGWVRVASEDAKGNILSVEIVVGEPPAEEPYLVLKGGQSAALEKLIGDWVVASGVVNEDKLGWKSIQVKRFTRVDDLQEETISPPKK